MFEIIAATVILLLTYIVYNQSKRIDALVNSQETFYTAYAEYLKAVGKHNEMLHDCIGKLEDKSVTGYYAVTSLANHVSYLEKLIHAVEEKTNALQR